MIAMRRELAGWMTQAFKSQRMAKPRAEILSHALLGTLEARFMHAYLHGTEFSEANNHAFVKNLVAEILG